MNKDVMKMIAAAKLSCKTLLSMDKAAAVAPMLKWVDVVDAMVVGDQNLIKKDLETIIIEPLKIISDACVARLKMLGREPNVESTAADKHKETMAGDVFARQTAYIAYVNELFSMLEALTSDRYPRIKP